MSKPTLSPIKPLVLKTELSPLFALPFAAQDPEAPHWTPEGNLMNAMTHDIKLLHSLVPFLALMDEAVAADDSNVSPNATAYKLKEALAAYREARS